MSATFAQLRRVLHPAGSVHRPTLVIFGYFERLGCMRERPYSEYMAFSGMRGLGTLLRRDGNNVCGRTVYPSSTLVSLKKIEASLRTNAIGTDRVRTASRPISSP